ncbi:MAG: ureidoglycolate lyase [Lachnospiraceae bacterium]|nr:ureidoglycolate lyase [Candidatus Equihabitans merdae]
MRTIKAKPITAENFRAFGEFASVMNPSGMNFGEFYRDQVLMPVSGEMPMAFSPLVVRKADKMIVETAEIHDKTPEMSVCLDDDIVLHVAPASNGPVPELTEAFIVPQGTIVRVNAGVWHFAAMPINKEVAHVIIGLPERTYKNDCTVVNYSDDDKVEIVL